MHVLPQRARLSRLTPLAVAALLGGRASIRMEGETPAPIDDSVLAGYRERQATMADASRAILARCDAESREPTGEEMREVRENTAEIARLGELIDTRQQALAHSQRLAAPAGRQTTVTATTTAQTPAPAAQFQAARDLGNPQRHSKTFGFGHMGEFSAAVRRAALQNGERDARLNLAAASSIATESVGADGGFLVPPEFRDRILSHVFDAESLIGRTDQQITSRNAITFPMDETTPWGTNGVRVYWENEAAAITQSRPSLGEMTLKTNKLAALIPVTEELLEDAPGLGNYLEGVAGRGMDYAVANAIIDGTGTGQPLGILRSGALVTVAAEAGQTADTVNVQNVSKMFFRLPLYARRNAVWLVNTDVEQQLMVMTLGGTAAAYPIFLPPNGLSQSPLSTLMGRPVIPHMACKALGDIGDIVLADLQSYVTAVKTGGIKQDVSMHLWFDQNLVAYRFTLRLDGRPWMRQPISPPNGTSTLSPFIALAAR